MALTFGVTVLPDPPASRLVELMKLGEDNGFEIGWTYDSHVLWQESFVQLTLAIQATTRMKFGHLVTNPGTREPTVLASLYATMHDISDGRMVMGIGRGDSARRYIGQQPVRVAEFERRLRMIKPFMNGKEVDWNDKDLQLKWVRPELPEIPIVLPTTRPRITAQVRSLDSASPRTPPRRSMPAFASAKSGTTTKALTGCSACSRVRWISRPLNGRTGTSSPNATPAIVA